MQQVAIHSVPRSGSTWLGSIFDSHPSVCYRYQPLFSYGHKGRLTTGSTKEDINNFYKEISNTVDEFVLQVDAKKRGIVPNFEKLDSYSHTVYKEVRYHNILKNLLERSDSTKVVGLIRNPVKVIDSWFHAPKEFRADLGWRIEDEWYEAAKKNLNKVEEYNGFLKWKEAAYLFEELASDYPDRFRLVIYEDLVENSESVVHDLFEFVGLGMQKQTQEFLRLKIEKADAYSVYKVRTKTSKEKYNLPQHIVDRIYDELSGTTLQKYLP